jgi:hypothetical protein
MPLPEEGYEMHVYKTAAGDYAMVCYHEGDPCGGDPEYFDTLRDAKATAERVAKGNWQAYTLDATSALA